MSDFELMLTADSRGLVSGEKALDNIAATAERTQTRAGKALTEVGKAAEGVGKQSIFASQQMRMTSMQLSQVAQQASVTGNWLQAIAIQLPDLALGFGPIGILAGAAAGALLPLAANLVMTQDEADKLSDKIEDLERATEAYEQAVINASLSGAELVQRFGEQAEQAQEVYEALRRIAELDYYKSLATAQSGISTAMSDLQASVERVQVATTNFFPADAITAAQQEIQYLNKEFGLTLIQANSINNALEDLASANGPQEAAAAAKEFSDALDTAAAEGAKITPEMREVQKQALQAAIDAGRFSTLLGQAKGQAAGLAGTMGTVADEATRAANNIAAALNAKQTKAIVDQLGPLNTLNAFERTPFQDEMQLQNERAQNTKSQYQIAAEKAAKASERGSRATVNKAERERKAVADLIAELEEELSLVNAGDAAKRSAAASRQAGASATDAEREKIVSLTEAIYQEEEARDKLADQRDVQKDLTRSVIDDMKSALDDGKISWKEWADIGISMLDKITDKLLDDVLDSIFTVNNAATGSGGGGGLLSSLFGGLFGGNGRFAKLPSVGPMPTARPLSFDGGGYTGSGTRTGGLDGKGGFMALLHPDETVTDHTRASSGTGSREGRTVIEVKMSPDVEGRIMQNTSEHTVRVVRQNNSEQKELYQNGQAA